VPSVSEKQKKFMRAAAHNKEFADKADIPQSVAKEFVAEDKKVNGSKSQREKRYGKE